VAQQDRRLHKLSVLKELLVPPTYLGPENPDVLLVSWGSPNGAVRETARTHEGPGTLAALTFTQVWPLVPETFLPYLTAARRVVVVEGNSTGQFARLLTWAAGFSASHAIRRYDGRAMTVQYIRQGLRSLLEE
jgi:2-oxoglutarate ferredoxin oxidoreductase subunit alpha